VHLAWVADKKLENLSVSGIEAEVCADIALRQAKGISKYGTTVADNPLALREWLQHGYEEALDMAIYLKRAMHEIDQAQDDGK
jgi:nicotinamidase-related amidase